MIDYEVRYVQRADMSAFIETCHNIAQCVSLLYSKKMTLSYESDISLKMIYL